MSPTQPWTILVPVKETHLAKSRLTEFEPADRTALALAFALDTLSAALACRSVATAVAVTNDAAVRTAARRLGAEVLPDVPAAGLNPALAAAASTVRAEGRARVAALSSDLPALTAETLSIVLDDPPAEYWFVADGRGDGTTMLGASGAIPLRPRFGPHSSAAHASNGALAVGRAGLERLRQDVDTEADLTAALRLGVGTCTARALAEMRAALPRPQ
ncbi:MAG TPA: 2-phospho-L-lactate guanylyltransferase [Nocardioidaceae bacterium]|nr:2-phospho-L-lactate guanylyltransferase [Nocardioidaceae bacterium]